MGSRPSVLPLLALPAILLAGCGRQAAPASAAGANPVPAAGQAAVTDHESQKDIVKVAIASAAHGTLVSAVQASELVDVLANAGPFTVFAPTSDAFKLLPADTLGDLLRPANKEKLRDLLQYHVAVAVYRTEMLRDGMILNMANGDNLRITVRDGRITLNGAATVTGSVPAANGIIHVIDRVLLPPPGK